MRPVRKSLVLIVDDDSDYRESLLPIELERIGARSVAASDVDGALRLIESKFGPGSSDRLDLVILDMHMPLGASPGPIDEKAGVKLLNKVFGLHEYRLIDCPVVVFTAYGSFRNCVSAVQAGAAAYIPKAPLEDTGEGGLNDLLSNCKALLFPEATTASNVLPSSDWLRLHGKWLQDRFHGKWVAFCREQTARYVGFTDTAKYPSLDGVVLLSGHSYEEVRSVVVTHPTLFEELPVIVEVAPD
jgi:CheY-like chemotaxis protein